MRYLVSMVKSVVALSNSMTHSETYLASGPIRGRNPKNEERSHEAHDPHTLFHDYIHKRNYRMKRIEVVAHHER
jgi:hypothetical protein